MIIYTWKGSVPLESCIILLTRYFTVTKYNFCLLTGSAPVRCLSAKIPPSEKWERFAGPTCNVWCTGAVLCHVVTVTSPLLIWSRWWFSFGGDSQCWGSDVWSIDWSDTLVWLMSIQCSLSVLAGESTDHLLIRYIIISGEYLRWGFSRESIEASYRIY